MVQQAEKGRVDLMSIPVIFIHQGDNDYLKYSLRQAKNINDTVILIGDHDNNQYEFIQHQKISDYSTTAIRFASVYIHRSPNGHDYELFCFQRWFILRDFLKRNKIDKCYYQDSDVMLCCDVTQNHFHSYKLALFHGSGHSIFIHDFNKLEEFCSFIENYYKDPSLFNHLIAYHQEKGYPGISDMVLLRIYFEQLGPSIVKDISHITNDSVFDGNINHANGFETVNGRKKVYRIGKEYYFKHLDADKFIKINALHMQGDAKQYMKFFVQDGSLTNQNGRESSFDYLTYQWRLLN